MTVKIISKTVKICSLIIYAKCFIREIFFKIVRMITGQISFFLIIPKILPGMVLMIANAKVSLCAGRSSALTSFCYLFRKPRNVSSCSSTRGGAAVGNVLFPDSANAYNISQGHRAKGQILCSVLFILSISLGTAFRTLSARRLRRA